jgi:hypothetical protein
MKVLVISAAVGVALGAVLPALAANSANERIKTWPEPDRLLFLGMLVNDGCVATKSFFQGIGTSGFAKDKAYWGVQCADGRSFEIEVDPDATSNKLTCAEAKQMSGVGCFEKMPQ